MPDGIRPSPLTELEDAGQKLESIETAIHRTNIQSTKKNKKSDSISKKYEKDKRENLRASTLKKKSDSISKRFELF